MLVAPDMKRWSRAPIAISIVIAITLGAAFGQERGTTAEAQKMVQDAIVHVQKVGAAKAFEEFSAPGGKWHNKDLYVFCYTMTGTCVCQGDNKALIGKNLIDFQTADGQFIIRAQAQVAKSKGSGWTPEYKWVDSVTKKLATKRTYLSKIPGYDGFLGVGIFK